MRELNGKIAVVTGGASGIGRAMAERFATEGMKVVLADVEPTALQATADEFAAAYGADKVLAVTTDVRDPASVQALADATIERFGAVHVLCNNAGVGSGGLTWEVETDIWRWVVEVNLLGVAYGVRSFVPLMVAQDEGHVINTASAAGLLTGPGMAPYFSTKHAVVAMSESLALDLANRKSAVGVSVLCPEWVRGTRIHDAERNLPETLRKEDGDAATENFVAGMLASLINHGTAPEDLAAQVLDAIVEEKFWVLPHSDSTLEAARARWAAIEAGEVPPAWDFGVKKRPPSEDGQRRGRRKKGE